MSTVLIIVFSLLLLLVSLGFILQGYFSIRDAIKSLHLGLASRSWLSTQGQISFANMDMEDLAVMGNSYQEMIVYDYCVDGRVFSNDRLSFNTPLFTASKPNPVEAILSKYPEGQKVTVYYDQDDPISSTLQPEVNIILMIVTILYGVVMLLAGAAILRYITSLF